MNTPLVERSRYLSCFAACSLPNSPSFLCLVCCIIHSLVLPLEANVSRDKERVSNLRARMYVAYNLFSFLAPQIPEGRLQLTLSGHGGIINDLSWSHDDHVIISASSDCTARCWVLSAMPSQLYLPHPSYVYAAQFHPTIPWLAVTGGYDGVVRGWGVYTGETPSAVKVSSVSTICTPHCAHL